MAEQRKDMEAYAPGISSQQDSGPHRAANYFKYTQRGCSSLLPYCCKKTLTKNWEEERVPWPSVSSWREAKTEGASEMAWSRSHGEGLLTGSLTHPKVASYTAQPHLLKDGPPTVGWTS